MSEFTSILSDSELAWAEAKDDQQILMPHLQEYLEIKGSSALCQETAK